MQMRLTYLLSLVIALLLISNQSAKLADGQLEAVGAVLSVVPVTSILATAGLVGVKLAALSRLLQALGYDQAYLASGGSGTAAQPIGLQTNYAYMFPYVPGLNISVKGEHGSPYQHSANGGGPPEREATRLPVTRKTYPAMGLPGDYEAQNRPFRGSEALREIFRDSGIKIHFPTTQQQQQIAGLTTKGNGLAYPMPNNNPNRVSSQMSHENINVQPVATTPINVAHFAAAGVNNNHLKQTPPPPMQQQQQQQQRQPSPNGDTLQVSRPSSSKFQPEQQQQQQQQHQTQQQQQQHHHQPQIASHRPTHSQNTQVSTPHLISSHPQPVVQATNLPATSPPNYPSTSQSTMTATTASDTGTLSTLSFPFHPVPQHKLLFQQQQQQYQTAAEQRRASLPSDPLPTGEVTRITEHKLPAADGATLTGAHRFHPVPQHEMFQQKMQQQQAAEQSHARVPADPLPTGEVTRISEHNALPLVRANSAGLSQSHNHNNNNNIGRSPSDDITTNLIPLPFMIDGVAPFHDEMHRLKRDTQVVVASANGPPSASLGDRIRLAAIGRANQQATRSQQQPTQSGQTFGMPALNIQRRKRRSLEATSDILK